MLYKFEQLEQKLNDWQFPKIKGSSDFQVIKNINFETAYKSGSIFFEPDGIYLEYDGKKYRGYMFIKEPWITVHNTYPVFHLIKCSTIEKFIASGKFKTRYEWSNSNVNDLIDITTKKIYKDQVLQYCVNCWLKLFSDIKTTEDFYESLDKDEVVPDKIEVDIFGYVRDKEKISKAFREKKNYTCENCFVKPKQIIHRRYWHTHHKDGNKIHNHDSNLECLCVLCHCYKDLKHEENFDTSRMQVELNSFVNIYRIDLEKLNNPYLEKFNRKSNS